MKYETDYIILFEFLIRLVASQKGTPLTSQTRWLGDVQHVATKLQMHLGSLFYLTRGTKLPKLGGNDISYIDYSSLFVLARAAYETYLNFNFIFVAPQTIMEKKFRHMVWELGALVDRQKFPVTEGEDIIKLKSEKQILDSLLQEILSDKVYFSLPSDRQKEARKGNWQLGYYWSDLAEFAGLDREEFKAAYRFLCSYAHTGNLSVFQMSQGSDPQTQTQMAETSLGFALGIMAHFISDYIKMHPNTTALYKQLPKAEELVFIYDGFGKKADDGHGSR